ncbi:MAG: lipase maturation factor family protein [Chthoniobacteraceae bacterium]
MTDSHRFTKYLDTASRRYWLTRFVLLRWIGFIYAVAFLCAAQQIVPLIGEHGLTPAGTYLGLLEEHYRSRGAAFAALPGLFWFGHSDAALVAWAWIGFALAAVVMCGFANVPMMTALWAIYMSFIHVGQEWYGYGWEIQLLETGFLAIFLCPLLDARPFPRHPPPVIVVWLFRWLGFRIMLGAGLIKLRGDACWSDFTCMYYHYLTQPIPNPLSRAFHFMPQWFHKVEVLWNHFIELIVPWFSFGPRTARHIAGVLLISFQFILILSGNLSFLNWLTIVPFIACFDDSLLARVLPFVRRGADSAPHQGSNASLVPSLCLALIVVFLSLEPVANLFSARQAMNTSFTSLHLVNTYGAFGSVGRERREIVFEGTRDSVLTDRTEWREYDFVAKPGTPTRAPRVIAPYQPRIDWQIWFAAMATHEHYPWTVHLVWKLLHNDTGALSLLATNPFPGEPPRYIRARYYRYEFAPPGGSEYWKRTELGLWLPPLSVDDPAMRQFLIARRWLPPEK